MDIFKRKKETPMQTFPSELYEAVIRSSICTGEKVACMRNRETGKLTEISLIRSETDLENFRSQYGITDEIHTVY